jgi:hypothetical protein
MVGFPSVKKSLSRGVEVFEEATYNLRNFLSNFKVAINKFYSVFLYEAAQIFKTRKEQNRNNIMLKGLKTNAVFRIFFFLTTGNPKFYFQETPLGNNNGY